VGEYSFGFNSQEKDKELWGGSISFKYRVEDSRLGRFFSVDPMVKNYPHNSSYSVSQNSVILYTELEGCESYYAGDGRLICTFGTDNTMRVISDMELVKKIRLSPENYMPDWFYSNSTPARIFDCSQNIHQMGVDAINLGAAMYSNLALKTQDAELREGYIQASWLLKCFASGANIGNVFFQESDGLTKQLNKDNQLLKEVASDFTKILNTNFSAEKNGFDTALKEYFSAKTDHKGGYEFSPDHAGFEKSLDKHLKAIAGNPLEFVIGGMSYTMTPVKDTGGNIEGFNVQFSNVMGKESLFLHQATNLPPSKFNVGLENISMTFNFYVTKDEMLNLLNDTAK
jgi:hypothetical protein